MIERAPLVRWPGEAELGAMWESSLTWQGFAERLKAHLTEKASERRADPLGRNDRRVRWNRNT